MSCGSCSLLSVLTSSVLSCSLLSGVPAEQCKPGTSSITGLETCESCPLGEYQPEFGTRRCLKCPENTSTVIRGAQDVNECGGEEEEEKGEEEEVEEAQELQSLFSILLSPFSPSLSLRTC